MKESYEFSDVIICDDHYVSAIGVEMLLSQHSSRPLNIRKASTGEKVLELFTQKSSDLLIVDLGLPGISGIEVIKKIRQMSPTTKIIVLTGQNEPHLLKQVYQLKVCGILRKMGTGKNLGEALNFIQTNTDKTYLDTSVTSILKDQSQATPTPREYEVLELMSKGHTSEEIAKEMDCSLSTIKTYKARIMNKSGAKNSAEMISWYLKRN
ncbi:hypothetical protein C0V70_13525 [Bacteriovorax stolpii]|uniref:Uncharacterized protein n=1 Tax=Bacteriovorax stolpii TaxID=960 RepID=A0A2K9NUC7_BACTC|nr:response regulator transcription factor [Bacteriovorax stolpii]AUN99102.1 hypothetical protein C0V70_13525 [Bacteriovorax stolpii]TDP55367.1 LuxR family two component transcriptional regulator [Bacteriovorax stolpii]